MENPPLVIEGVIGVNTPMPSVALLQDIKAAQVELTKNMEDNKPAENKYIQEAMRMLLNESREQKARTVKVLGVNVVCMTQNEFLTGVPERLAY